MYDNDDNQPTGGSELSTAIPSTSEPRMSSLEIAKITEKQHRNVLRDIEKTLTEVGIDLPKFESIFLDSYKREQPCYLLPRRECDLIMTGYSAKYRLAIIDRWIELEGLLAERKTVELKKEDTLTLPEWFNELGLSMVTDTDVCQVLSDRIEIAMEYLRFTPKSVTGFQTVPRGVLKMVEGMMNFVLAKTPAPSPEWETDHFLARFFSNAAKRPHHKKYLRVVRGTVSETGKINAFKSIIGDTGKVVVLIAYRELYDEYMAEWRETAPIARSNIQAELKQEDAWIKLKDKPGTHRHRLRQKNGVRDILRAFWALDYEKLNPALKAVFRPIYEREHEEQAAIHAIHSKP